MKLIIIDLPLKMAFLPKFDVILLSSITEEDWLITISLVVDRVKESSKVPRRETTKLTFTVNKNNSWGTYAFF